MGYSREIGRMTRLAMPRPVPVLSSTLVTLRPPNPSADAQDYFEMNVASDMHTWTGNEVLESPAQAQMELMRYIAMEDVSTWMIIDNPSGRVVGRFFLILDDRHGLRVVEVGNRIAKAYWRCGHNRAARTLLFHYAFDDLQADVIEMEAWSGNTNSIKSIESYGFHHDRDADRWNKKHEQMMIMKCYSMTKERWKALADNDTQL